MTQEHILYNSRFLKEYTLAILQVIEKKEYNITGEKEVIQKDLLPKFAELLNNEYTLNKELIKKLKKIETFEIPKKPKIQQQPIQSVIEKPLTKPEPIPPLKKRIQQKPQKRPQTQQPAQMPTQEVLDASNGYQKIKNLIQDPSVSRIQCIAPNKPIVIIRSGQKQITKIALNNKQIKDVFQEMADEAHIPLIEGPFKIILDELTINGIHSKFADAKFIIQKQNAYSLLEQNKK